MSLPRTAPASHNGRHHSTVLVTGGTGTLGRELVQQLSTAGHNVRVMARHLPEHHHPRVGAVIGDVRTGAGVRAAAAGTDVIVHAATNPRRRMRQTEVDGARRVAAAARESGAHLIYVSIVGVDRHRLPYYKAKAAAEQEVIYSGARSSGAKRPAAAPGWSGSHEPGSCATSTTARTSRRPTAAPVVEPGRSG